MNELKPNDGIELCGRNWFYVMNFGENKMEICGTDLFKYILAIVF